MVRPLEQVVIQAIDANKDKRPIQLLLEMERAIRAMHAKDYGPGGTANVVADLLLTVVDPELRELWIDP